MLVKSKGSKRLSPALVFYFNIFLQLTLFVIFLAFFGIPSVSKYLDQETIIISSEEETNGIEAPAITFLALKNHMGWKSVANITYKMFKIFDHCEKIVGLPDIGACVSNDTFEFADFIKEASVGLSDLSKSSLQKKDLTITLFGRHFTLKLQRTITRKESNIIIFKMDTNPAFSYYIWVHDEKYFLTNNHPFRKKMCENYRFLWMPPQNVLSVLYALSFCPLTITHPLSKTKKESNVRSQVLNE